jgi:hypothetical protein
VVEASFAGQPHRNNDESGNARLSRRDAEMSRGGRRTGSGRKEAPSEIMRAIREKTATRYLYQRLKELRDLNTEGTKREADKIAMKLVDRETPVLQAIQSHTLVEHGDTLRLLLKEIDGTSLGINNSKPERPALEIGQSLLLPNQGWPNRPM